jgi:hypothetical protein
VQGVRGLAAYYERSPDQLSKGRCAAIYCTCAMSWRGAEPTRCGPMEQD